ncbi:hypothetical protein ACIRPH_31395 [Nocardiopsis sp. NPDC101807]|uniref:hypothetical protein n=1 Tax=Nocardiopsis sp. NPDC101807 TaxID=3364339 RepID=UPI0037F78203
MDLMEMTTFLHRRLDEMERQVWRDLISEYPGTFNRADQECRRWLQGRALGVEVFGDIKLWRHIVDACYMAGDDSEDVRAVAAKWADHPDYDPAWA